MDDLLSEFLTETAESLDVVDVELVQFERDPNNAEILDNIFRLVHTIKGTCGFLGLPRLEALAHAAETLMGKFRDGAPVTQNAVSVILLSIDRIKEILAELEAAGTEPEGSDNDLISQLEAMSLGSDAASGDGGDAASGDGGDAEEAEAPAATAEDAPLDVPDLERELKPGEVSLDDLEAAFQAAPGPEENGDEGVAEAAPEAAESMPEPAEAEPVAAAEPVAEAEPKPSEAAPTAGAEPAAAQRSTERKESSVKTQSIRVNVDTLEHLMTMVSELVLTRNQLLEMVRRLDDSEFKVPLQRLSNVTAELQEGVMKTRMQPIGNAWQKLPRIVRDLANDLNKKIELEMRGAETELDRQVLELIKDPLTHMVRNSADHGIEDPEERLARGKPEGGRILLSAYHEGGHIIIEIADDGKGLPVEKIKAKAVAQGLATEAEAEKMTPAQINKLIFAPGFSTAAKVTNVSGRGVGMDVVRTNIELIGGSIDVRSNEGQGSTFVIKIPLTLAIVSALIVQAREHRFAIPQLNVVELVRANTESDHRIELINETPVLRLRNRLLPLVQLASVLQLNSVDPALPEEPVASEPVTASEETPPAEDASGDEVAGEEATPAEATPAEATTKKKSGGRSSAEGFIIVTQVGNQEFGIVVDSVFDTEEIVVKPMSTRLRDIDVFSGNTILGDGSVIMIVDPNGIAQRVSHQSGSNSQTDEEAEALSHAPDSNVMSLLIFRAGSDQPKAVPLSLVTRLEQIEVEAIEVANGQELVQYRGQLMPLVRTDGDTERRSEGRQPVLVFSDGQRTMGLAVDAIVDIVEDALDIEVGVDKAGIIGSAVVKEKATEIIDVGHYISGVFEDWDDGRPAADDEDGARKLLLVDDSSFFRNMLSPVLKSAGYSVTAVPTAKDALALKDAGAQFDVIISDIDMPELDGYQFASTLREDSSWGRTPIIALSCHASDSELERGRQAGFFDFVGKFDREGLVRTVSGSLYDLEDAA